MIRQSFAFIVSNLKGGGAEKAILKLAAALSAKGNLVHIILLENVIEYSLMGEFNIHILKKCSRGFLGKRIAAYYLRRQIEKLGPLTAVISTLPYADEIASLAGLPNLWHRIANTLSSEIDSLKKNSPRKAKRRLKRYKKIYGNAHLIALSQGMYRDLVELFPKADVRIIPNLFEVNEIEELASKADENIPKEPFVLHVGRFSPQKRFDVLLDAWKRANRKEKLVLLTNRTEELEALISHYGLKDRVLVPGFQQNPYNWMRHARLLVLSSDREGLPNVIIESLICGTPVVSTNCPSGPSEILKKEFLVPCGDSIALANVICTTLSKKEAIVFDPAPFSSEVIVQSYKNLSEA